MKFRQLEHTELTTTRRTFPLRLVLESVQVPDNVGMIFRLAEAFGVERIYLTGGSIAPPNQKISKVSRKTIKEIDFQVVESTASVIAQLKLESFFVIGLEVTTASASLRDFDFKTKEKIVLVVGSEKHGISIETLGLLDACVAIPLLGKTTSLNVATALAIALYEVVSQRKVRGVSPPFPPQGR